MTGLCFADANVLVYARDTREPSKNERAKAWLERLWREHTGRTSVQVLSEYYVTLTRKLTPRVTPANAWDDVTAFLSWRPQSIDESLLHRGRQIEERYRITWWDSLIVAAAQVQGCSILLSEDFQDGGVYDGVTVRNPFTLAVNEPIPAYEARSLARHPPRGRPKKSPAVRSAA
jgi:predicted nucleic acid-binding protein